MSRFGFPDAAPNERLSLRAWSSRVAPWSPRVASREKANSSDRSGSADLAPVSESMGFEYMVSEDTVA
ncbi:hypothetical protein RSSM_03919 [Rhodopirellula sallentina SM41]|uniref:Uncharacterized protein n=1 Tax=Rhodopirellula sallentina SM41 TaxID=1263870 RepID=M5TZM5_9BACT|nr:hypothetical protein RSSM_03919 [Rhodopirellula sallentina SM41]